VKTNLGIVNDVAYKRVKFHMIFFVLCAIQNNKIDLEIHTRIYKFVIFV
jgi:hypothetical protein